MIRESASEGHNATFLLRLMMVAPALAMIVLIPLIGRFSDRFERGHILVLGLATLWRLRLAAFLSPSIEWILASRFLLGAALAIIMTITTASTGDIFAPPERNHVLGLQYLASTGIGMTAPALAGCVALIDWRLNFMVYLGPSCSLRRRGHCSVTPQPTGGSRTRHRRASRPVPLSASLPWPPLAPRFCGC